jgi:hypothetical protein
MWLWSIAEAVLPVRLATVAGLARICHDQTIGVLGRVQPKKPWRRLPNVDVSSCAGS